MPQSTAWVRWNDHVSNMEARQELVNEEAVHNSIWQRQENWKQSQQKWKTLDWSRRC